MRGCRDPGAADVIQMIFAVPVNFLMLEQLPEPVGSDAVIVDPDFHGFCVELTVEFWMPRMSQSQILRLTAESFRVIDRCPGGILHGAGRKLTERPVRKLRRGRNGISEIVQKCLNNTASFSQSFAVVMFGDKVFLKSILKSKA